MVVVRQAAPPLARAAGKQTQFAQGKEQRGDTVRAEQRQSNRCGLAIKSQKIARTAVKAGKPKREPPPKQTMILRC
jgi:hypothetical protein